MGQLALERAEQIKRSGIIAIIRGDFGLERLLEIGRVLAENGINVMEITLNSAGALDAIAALLAQPPAADVLIGAGTVRTAAQAEQALTAGAQFLVTPNFNPDVVARAHAADRPITPGIFTATEAHNAFAARCSMVKLFPADALGPSYLKALRAPLDDIDFVPTGGIGPDNVAEYVRAGAAAVGVGSTLVRGADQDAVDLAARAQALRRAWDAAAAEQS